MGDEKSYKELFLETMIEKYSKLYNTTKDDYYLYMCKHYKHKYDILKNKKAQRNLPFLYERNIYNITPLYNNASILSISLDVAFSNPSK